MSERARVVGTVLAVSDPAPCRWQVRVGRRRYQRSDGGWFEVAAGGARYWVEVSSLVEILGDAGEEDGLLDELAARAGFVGDFTPGDTPATLTRVAIAVGETVAVDGEATGPGTVRGVLVTCGPGAAEQLERVLARREAEPPRDPRLRRRRPTGQA